MAIKYILNIILFIYLHLELFAQNYHPSDSSALLEIDAACDASNSLNWDTDPDPGNWDGVTWDTIDPGRVIKLHIGNNNLSGTLDVRSLSELKILSCFDNNLTGLIVSGLDSLMAIHCNYNQLDSLNISNLGNIRTLQCMLNELIYLNVSGCSLLDDINCEYNNLEILEMPELSNFRFLYCSFNDLTTLDVTRLPNLVDLICDYNQLASLDLSGQTTLFQLGCSHNNLSVLDISEINITGALFCNNNDLSFLDASSSEDIYDVRCENNRLPFSSLITAVGRGYFTYAPQNEVFLPATVEMDTIINYSSEALIDGITTEFVFFRDGEEEEINTSGMFHAFLPGVYHCEMTNAKFPGLVLTTAPVTVTQGTGFQTNGPEVCNIYPNPVTEILKLDVPFITYQVELYDVDGRTLYKASNITEIDMSVYSAGVYYVEVNSGNEIWTGKIVKRHG